MARFRTASRYVELIERGLAALKTVGARLLLWLGFSMLMTLSSWPLLVFREDTGWHRALSVVASMGTAGIAWLLWIQVEDALARYRKRQLARARSLTRLHIEPPRAWIESRRLQR